MADPATYTYSIDHSDRLVSLSDSWLAFAVENDAPSLTRELVCGRSIWEFISGADTRQLYRLLFERVRADGRRRSVPFRCDSPDRLRFMELQLAPGADGIELCGVLLREQQRVYCPLFDTALPHAQYSFPSCSVCRRVFAFGAWLEVEEAVRRLGAFDTARPPGLEPGLCDACRRLLEGQAPETPAA